MLLSWIEIANRLSALQGWAHQENQIEKEFQFADFKDALRFVNLAGQEAEAMNHHPDIFLHGWNKVTIMISTHDAGGITALDFDLAHAIEGLVH
jgi:4a-hydroxytetrahydrobiopterin dehydratase